MKTIKERENELKKNSWNLLLFRGRLNSAWFLFGWKIVVSTCPEASSDWNRPPSRMLFFSVIDSEPPLVLYEHAFYQHSRQFYNLVMSCIFICPYFIFFLKQKLYYVKILITFSIISNSITLGKVFFFLRTDVHFLVVNWFSEKIWGRISGCNT